MAFRVFQNGKRCSDYCIKGWNVDTFTSKRKAEEFAYLWAYPVSKEAAVASAPEMELDKPYDYSMGVWSEEAESPVLMMIREVQ